MQYTSAMRRIIDIILLVAVVGGAGYFAYTHQPQLRTLWESIAGAVAPCTRPITYSLGSLDPRFGISTSTLLKEISEAEAIWEVPSGKDLFAYAPSGGAVMVSLIYDSRQAATDKLKLAGIQLSKSKSSYESLKAMYDTLSVTVASEQSVYEGKVAAYKRAEQAYNAEVERWNKKGGAPPAEYERLQADKAALALQFAEVKSLESAMNADIDTLNALATTLNQLIVQLNLNVRQYNRVGASAGEFEEGLYQLAGGVQTISIFEYANRTQLVRVLAHEMGHALELEHVADPAAIMYKINQSTSLIASFADIAELGRVCAK